MKFQTTISQEVDWFGLTT